MIALAAAVLSALVLALPGAGTDRPLPVPLSCKPAAPPQGQFAPGNRNPNSPAGVLWINRHCRS